MAKRTHLSPFRTQSLSFSAPRIMRNHLVKAGHCRAFFFIKYSAIAQSVERMTVNHDVTGSSPVCGVIGAIAQLAEHVIEAHGVGSSILSCAIYGGVAKWLNAADCKSALIEFGSSNLSPSIYFRLGV